jgi:signal transduction histidine kinase
MMAFFSNLSLSKRIVMIVLVGLAVGLGLFSWLGIQASRRSTQRILDERLVISRIIAAYLDESLNRVLLDSQREAQLAGPAPSTAQFAAAAAGIDQSVAEAGIASPMVFLVDSSGKVIQSQPEDSVLLGSDLGQTPEVKKALQNGVAAVSGLVTNENFSTPVEYVITPIQGTAGQNRGAIICAIDIQDSNLGVLEKTSAVGKTAYAEIVDENGIVIARTKPGIPPAANEKSDHPEHFASLIARGEPMVGTCHRCHESSGTVQRRADVLAFAPLSSASWGVALRQAQEEALAPTSQLEKQLLLLGLIVLCGTLLILWVLTQGIISPIKMLTAAAKRVAAGDFRSPISLTRQDEIGQLGSAFNSMTRELTRSRDELLARNDELSALNSLAASVSQSLDLKQLLDRALAKALEVTHGAMGAIYLAQERGFEIGAASGSSSLIECSRINQSESGCACQRVLRNAQMELVKHTSQCPLLTDEVLALHAISGFVSLPLKYQDRTLGILKIIYARERSLTENDFRLLDSIGYHIGLALENSRLYEDLKEKEGLRGELLGYVINAQEEERKRIAREIHDEYGQTLAGLMMNIESCELMMPAELSELKKKMASSKTAVSSALEEMRRLALDLRPAALDDLGLASAIRALARGRLEEAGINVTFEIEDLGHKLDPVRQTALFRVVQESINNIVKHAGAHNVSIKIKLEGDKILARIEDDGRGFDLAAIRSRIGVRSLGLLGIEERTALLGGRFQLESQPGRGTSLRIEIPVGAGPAGGAANG